MANIATTLSVSGTSVSPIASDSNSVPVSPTKTGSGFSSIDSIAQEPVRPFLTPRQKMMADMESLIGVFLQIFITSRTAAREHNMYLRESVACMVELEADKMMTSALLQLVGGVVQGAAGIVSGTLQVRGALGALKTIRDGVKGIEPQMLKESNALKELKAAEVAHKNSNQSAQAAVDLNTAQTTYGTAKAELEQAWVALRDSPAFKAVDAHVAYWNGVGAATRGSGEVVESAFKYGAASEDKTKMLLDAFKQYLQSSQQSNQDFERDLAEMNRQLLDQLKAFTDRSHQLNMNLGQAA